MDPFEFRSHIVLDNRMPVGYRTASGIPVYYGFWWRFWNWLGFFRPKEDGITI